LGEPEPNYIGMKNKYLAGFMILLFVNINTLYCQMYVAFPDSNAVWKTVYETYPPGPFPSYSFHFDNYIDGDTLVNSKQYEKIYKLGYNPNCSLITYGPGYVGSYRNDTSEKKVYFLEKSQTEEILLYDFSLSVGDTVPQTYINYSYPFLVVDHIDSILIGSNYHKRFYYLQESYPTIMVIEGIGAHTGLLEPMEIFDQYHYLRCFHLDNELLFINADSCNLETDTCISVSIFSPRIDDIKIKVFPNPAYDLLHINTSSQNDIAVSYQFVVRDTHGKLHLTQTLFSSHTLLPLKELIPGLYIWTIEKENQVIERGKIIKQ